MSKSKYSLAKNTYQRVQRGYMRVNITAENLYNCNYLMFQNLSFGNKWFYAFIRSVEYVNNAVSEIQYEIDVMQTWFFDYQLLTSYIDREHSSTDNIGDNLIPENLDTGEDLVVNGYYSYNMSTMNACILAADDTAPNGLVNGVYSQLGTYGNFPLNTESDVQTLFNFIKTKFIDTGQEDRIVAIFQYPAFIESGTSPTTVTQHIPRNTSSLGGYVPKNNKMWTYPYNFMLCSNNMGQTAVYKYENWLNSDWNNAGWSNFEIVGVAAPTPCVMLYPVHYRNLGADYDSGLTISNFPDCPWVGDTFKQWWAQNKNSVVTSGIITAMSAGLAGLSNSTLGGNPLVQYADALNSTNASTLATRAISYNASTIRANQALNAGGNIGLNLAKISDLQNTPPQIHGQVQTETLNAAINKYRFSFYQMSIKSEFARSIDQYFTRFGYATKQNKIPNRNVRPHWTYTKTIGCNVKGSVPCDDMNKICRIYDNGITFWKDGNTIGNYFLDNSI